MPHSVARGVLAHERFSLTFVRVGFVISFQGEVSLKCWFKTGVSFFGKVECQSSFKRTFFDSGLFVIVLGLGAKKTRGIMEKTSHVSSHVRNNWRKKKKKEERKKMSSYQIRNG